MSELICAREFAKSLLRQERERFCRALEDQQEEGVCYQWLRTMPVTKKFTCCQQLLNAFTRTYYLPFVYENPYAEGPFIQSMALYMKSPEKKTRKMYDTFHQKMTDYCHSVVGVLLGGTRGGRPLLFEEAADDTWWHYDDCHHCKKHATTWRDSLITEEGIWSGATRCPANRTCACAPEPLAPTILRQEVSEVMQTLLRCQHQYTLQLAKVGPVPEMKKQLCLEYWGDCDEVVQRLRDQNTLLQHQLLEQTDNVLQLESAEERHIQQSEETIHELENSVVQWRQRSLDLETQCKRWDNWGRHQAHRAQYQQVQRAQPVHKRARLTRFV
jgi:hypothetical protein